MRSGLNTLMTEFHSLFRYAQGSHHSALLSTHVIILLLFTFLYIIVQSNRYTPPTKVTLCLLPLHQLPHPSLRLPRPLNCQAQWLFLTPHSPCPFWSMILFTKHSSSLKVLFCGFLNTNRSTLKSSLPPNQFPTLTILLLFIFMEPSLQLSPSITTVQALTVPTAWTLQNPVLGRKLPDSRQV